MSGSNHPRGPDRRPADRVTVRELDGYSDSRGEVYEPLPAPELAGYRNFHLVVSRPGAVRGNHYHEFREEVMIVRGPAGVRVQDSVGKRTIDVPDRAAFRFDIPAGVPHAVENTGDGPGLILVFATTGREESAPDVHERILIE